MKKLLLLFTTTIWNLSSSSIAFLKHNETKLISSAIKGSKKFFDEYSGKESLFKYNFKTVNINDLNGLNNDNLLDAIFIKIRENNPEYEGFIIYLSENIEQFKITGNCFEIPNENESKSYNLRISASSNEPYYMGIAKINVVLTNKKEINIAQYQYIFSTKIFKILIEAIGHTNFPEIWEKDMLLQLDKQLIDNNANMYGFNGKNEQKTLFVYAFENKLIEIDFGEQINKDFSEYYPSVTIIAKSKDKVASFLQPNKTLKIAVDVVVKKAIDISGEAFTNYFKNSIIFSIPAYATDKQWKQVVFSEMDKKLKLFETKIGKKDLFSKNIDHLILSYTNKKTWEADYELYALEIITPCYVKNAFLQNKTLNITAKVNRIYPDISQAIDYFYCNEISARFGSSQLDTDEKEHIIYDLENDNFTSFQAFQKKYKTIKLDMRVDYNSNWPIQSTNENFAYHRFATKDLKDKNSSLWITIAHEIKKCWESKIAVLVLCKIYFEDNKVKVTTWIQQKIKINGVFSYYLKTNLVFTKAILSNS